MSNKNEDAKIWKAVGVMAVIAVVGYYAYNSWQETIDAQVQEQQKADAIEQHNQLMQLRSLGYTTKEDFKNSFGDYTGSLYTAWGMTDGDYMYIETDRYNVPQSVCFYSTPRDNGKITSYAPEFKTISVDMKIDGEKPYHLPLKETTDPSGCVFFLLLVSYATFKTRVI